MYSWFVCVEESEMKPLMNHGGGVGFKETKHPVISFHISPFSFGRRFFFGVFFSGRLWTALIERLENNITLKVCKNTNSYKKQEKQSMSVVLMRLRKRKKQTFRGEFDRVLLESKAETKLIYFLFSFQISENCKSCTVTCSNCWLCLT